MRADSRSNSYGIFGTQSKLTTQQFYLCKVCGQMVVKRAACDVFPTKNRAVPNVCV